MADVVVGLASGLLSGALIASVSWTIFRRQTFNALKQSRLDRLEDKIGLYKGLHSEADFCTNYIGEVLAEVLEAKADLDENPAHDVSPLGFNSFEEFSNFSMSTLRYPTERTKTEECILELRMSVKKFKATLKDLLSKSTAFSDVDALIEDLRAVQTSLVKVKNTIELDLKVLTDDRTWVVSQRFAIFKRNDL